jgi:pimeloyl-ACP methyl ester carboxylesterase
MTAGDLHYAWFHGLPGTPEEFDTFAPAALGARTIRIDRLTATGPIYEQALLSAFDNATRNVTEPLVLIGFSLGAMAALHVAARRPEKTARVMLASPASPLELGDFLPSMAGRMVFETARRGDWALQALSTVQHAALTLNWRFLKSQMLNGVSPAERRLMESPDASAALREGLRTCLGARRHAYHRELQAYVQPWSEILKHVASDVDIWQGTQDTWAPPSMAQALHDHLAPRATLKSCEGLGHYSTLSAMVKHMSGDETPAA